MATNNFAYDNQEIWAKEQQRVFDKRNYGVMVADTSFESQLSKGDTVNRPYRAEMSVQLYEYGTDATIDTHTDTNEQMTINRKIMVTFQAESYEEIQNNYRIVASYARDALVKVSNQIDSDILGETENAASVVDAGDVGGSAGTPITLGTTTTMPTLAAVLEKLALLDTLDEGNVYGIISPQFESQLMQINAGRDTQMGDKITKAGYIMELYGIKLFRSNLLAGSAVLGLATNPTANDTVVIAGQTFTFVSSIGTTAGNVLIAGAVDGTRANLEALINAPGTTTANGVALTGTMLRKFELNISAVNNDTTDTLRVFQKGAGTISVSETLTDGTDAWAKETQHNYFCVKGATALVIQSKAKVEYRDEPKSLITNGLAHSLFGYKTFADGAKMLVDVQIASSGF